MDLFVVPTIGFSLLYAFVIVRLDRRDPRLDQCHYKPDIGLDCASNDRGVFLGMMPQKYLIRDRIASMVPSSHADCAPWASGDKPTAPASRWQNGFAERLIGSIRRECLISSFLVRRICAGPCDPMLVTTTTSETHRSLDKDAPVSRPVQRTGIISSHAILGGLHHHYARV